jgi:predicted GNAT family N-acyltransferase
MMPSTPQILEWGSKQQVQSIGLRYEVLRKPLGLFFAPDELSEEVDQWHIGMINGDRVVAVLLLKKMNDRIAKMRQVAVDETLQGKGIGKELVRFSEEFCRRQGLELIELHARKTAVPFYLSMGYSLIGDEFEEVGIPHIKMALQL